MRKLWFLIGALAGLALLACAACRASGAGSAGAPTSPPALAPSPVAAVPTSEPATCTVSSRLPTSGPTEVSLFPAVSQADWKQGPDGARLVFVEYGDFQ